MEESGNILAMLYASAKVPGGKGKEQIERYWPIIEKWAGWLEGNTLYPGEQRTSPSELYQRTELTRCLLSRLD